MVEHPSEYKWSSYLANASNREDVLITNHPLYIDLSSMIEERLHAYRELFHNHLDYDTLHDIRDSLNHELVLGRSYFKDMIEDITRRQTRLGVAGRPSVNEPNSIYYVGY